MAKNVFVQRQEHVDPPKRNVFDLSRRCHMTMRAGYLYPNMFMEALPGDSFRISQSMGFRMMPMAFPIQSKVTAIQHFFKVPIRTLWDDWADFIAGNKDGLEMPYIDPDNFSNLKTGSLHDYIGVPTTVPSIVGSGTTLTFGYNNGAALNTNVGFTTSVAKGQLFISSYHVYSGGNLPTSGDIWNLILTANSFKSRLAQGSDSYEDYDGENHVGVYNIIDISITQAMLDSLSDTPYESVGVLIYGGNGATITSSVIVGSLRNEAFMALCVKQGHTYLFMSNEAVNLFNQIIDDNNYESYWLGLLGPYKANNPWISLNSPQTTLTAWNGSVNLHTGELQASSLPDTLNPFYNQNIRINALRYRAYEAIYNSFYRDAVNDPFKINGVAEYNKYIPNSAGGIDSTPYELHKRNWERDFLTSAVQSPQQGIAPLVGVTTNNVQRTAQLTFQASEDQAPFTLDAKLDDQGNITAVQTDQDTITPENEESAGITAQWLRKEMLKSISDSVSTSGISINDFRNVNALQRWLETNIRMGYRYREQVKAHFGVTPRYDTLDMPEFLGGVSRVIQVGDVMQTTDQGPDSPLGAYAGKGGILSGMEHAINCYCDEHSIIVGILCIVPVPAYSQLLNKELTKMDKFDYFFPEFDHIGMQPILNKEVTPVLAYSENTDENAVFGYQRPWYEYVSAVDEVHGEFRTTLQNFLIQRHFLNTPVLGGDFLKIDPADMDRVFAYQGATDKFIGQVVFDIEAKRPISRLAIPRLE